MGSDPPEIQQQNAWKAVWAELIKHNPNVTGHLRDRGMSGLDGALEEIKRLQALDAPKDACCDNEKRNMNGGCVNCGDPCL